MRRRTETLIKTCEHDKNGAGKQAQQFHVQKLTLEAVEVDLHLPHEVRREEDMVASTPRQRQFSLTSLTSLPNEIIAHILFHLDSSPPSETNAIERPDAKFTESRLQPLKSISLVSKRFRLLSLPLLFQHARLDPYHLTNFLSFVETFSLQSAIKTLTAILQGPCTHTHPAWWARLLNDIPLLRLTIHGAPHVFSELIGTAVDDCHDWAFIMPFQTLTLTQTPASACSYIDYNNLPNLLTAKSWHSLSYNEGSSLKAYSTYEFFLKTTPCLITSIYANRFEPGEQLFANLESFSFIAIFPFYNHVDEILKCVRKMKKLKHLFVKLCPEPESTVLKDELDLAKGHIDVNDPWNEFDTAYHLIAHSVRFLYLEGSLEEFKVDDVRMSGIHESLLNCLCLRLDSLDGFKHDTKGTWRKDIVEQDTHQHYD